MKIGIRSQITFLSSGLIIVSFLALLPYIIKKFTDDKAAYIYEQALNTAITVQEKTDQILKQFEDEARIFSIEPPAGFPMEFSNILIYKNYVNNNGLWILNQERVNSALLKQQPLDEQEKNKVDTFDQATLNSMVKRNTLIDYSVENGVPQVSVLIYSQIKNKVHLFKIIAADLDKIYSSESHYQNLLVSKNQYIIQNSGSAILSKDIILKINSNKIKSGVITEKIEGTEYLVGYSKLNTHDWLSVTLIPTDEAFLVVKKLLLKILGFSGVILSLAIIFASLIARNIINPINLLIKGTEEYSSENYHYKINVAGENELSALSKSFNNMGSKILENLIQLKDKIRMDKELEIAQLVQRNFFPQTNEALSNDLKISGYFKPASECSGDWWGFKEIEEKTFFYIADATGHGYSSALITATAHSCVSLLPKIIALKPELADSPGKILEFLNESIYQSGGKILMTFFLGVYDRKTSQITYANASHYTPILYSFNDKEPTKTDFTPLIGAEGYQLGHKIDAKFSESSIILNPNDVLYLLTDGFVESTNPENTIFGERRLNKLLSKNSKLDLATQKENFLSSIKDFTQDSAQNDDITFVLISKN